MAERRTERVEVETSSRTVILNWETRDQLFGRMRKRYGLAEVVREFENAGTSRPVKFPEHTREVLEVLQEWLQEGRDKMPPDGLELHDALHEDFFGAAESG